MLAVTLIFICAGAALAKPYFSLDQAEKHFEDFIEKYDRKYASEKEKQMRLEIFKQSLKIIIEKNMDPDELAEFGINLFSDMTKEEIKPFIGVEKECKLLSDSHLHLFDEVHQCKIQGYVDENANIPDSIDWREKNVVTSVKLQKCGDCWTFGTTGNVESMYAMKYGKLLDFSEQQLVDCDKNNNGCNGGTYNYSFGGLVTIGGMMELKDYPYAGIGDCKFDINKVVAKLKDCIIYDLKDEEQLRSYVATNGPVAVSINSKDIQSYSKGILSKCAQERQESIDHAMLVVGYGTENGIPYWIIKNSWGEQWGEEGYLRMKRNENLCGIVNPCAATAVIE